MRYRLNVMIAQTLGICCFLPAGQTKTGEAETQQCKGAWLRYF